MAGLPKKYIKKWGISKKAWREYRKDTGTRKGSPTRKTSRKRGPKTGKRKGGGGGKKTFGQFGFVGILSAGLLLAVAKYASRLMLPTAGAYAGGISAVAAGGAAKMLDLSGKSMFSFGLIDLVSEGVVDLMKPGGRITGPWVSAPSANGNNGGYQY